MGPMALATRIEAHLLSGCLLEADRCDLVWLHLQSLLNLVTGPDYPLLAGTVDEIRVTSGLLRELADLSRVHHDRVSVVLNDLNVVLPCLSRTLRDIQDRYESKAISRSKRWQRMYVEMAEEVGGIYLPQRFQIYNACLVSLRDLLTRSITFDLNTLEALKMRILQMREARGICAPPAEVGPPISLETLLAPMIDPTVHWAENIFSLPLPSRTKLKRQKLSMSFGQHQTWADLYIPPHSRILFRRSFNDDLLSLTAFLSGDDDCPYFLIRAIQDGRPWFSVQGTHELCIERDDSSLQLKRWIETERCSTLWAVLYFITWEEMVLFHATFVSLKLRNERTLMLGPEEHNLGTERKMFQARILDDGFKHSLLVFRDITTGGWRLHAAVWEGELRRCPVWTAFVTHSSKTPSWVKRTARNKVRLADVQLYVFCREYRQQSQRQGGVGPFEIHFRTEEAARSFKELFKSRTPEIAAPPPPSPPPPSP